jgi:hypothetical protein
MRPRPDRSGLTVLLVADPPPSHRRPDAESPAGRHEAIVALARAVFAEGGQLAVPADADIALVVGTVALDYAAPPVAERRGQARPSHLTVMETGGFEHATRVLLAPLAVRGALRYLDSEGDEVGLDLTEVEAEEPGLEEVRRHRVTRRMVEVTRPTMAVVLSPQRPAIRDLDVLRELQVRPFVFQDSVLEADLELEPELRGMEDPTQRLLDQAPGERWSRPRRPDDVRPVPPYPYLMQRLVAEWTGRGG